MYFLKLPVLSIKKHSSIASVSIQTQKSERKKTRINSIVLQNGFKIKINIALF